MHGKIYFNDIAEVGEFLKAFTGSTALFEVRRFDDTKWILEFTGGY